LIAILAFIVTCNAGPAYIPAPAVYAAAPVIIEAPTPYAFGYDVTDEFGTTLTRQESGDGSGAVRGAYSYKDAKGLVRVVNYVADALGYRANVDTNEPGTETSAPASAVINSNAVPVAAVLARPVAPLIAAPVPVVAPAPLLIPRRRYFY
jgi:hypothetical protein